MEGSMQSFREKLEEQYKFPALYMFKFIVPKDKAEEVTRLFPKAEAQMKPSKNGNYVSVTAKIMASSSDQIVGIYEAANKIEGIIAL